MAATVGAANSLYAFIDGRRRELAILRAVGFHGLPIIASVVAESILLALLGALVASFHMAVTPSLVLLGSGWALCIGLIASLLPALRASRVPVTVALRAT